MSGSMRVTMKSILNSIVRGTPELPQGRLRQAVVHDLFDQLAAIMRPLSIITAINGSVVALAFMQFTTWWLALIWVGPILFFSYYQYAGSKSMVERSKSGRVGESFLKKGARNNFLFGAWWALSCIIFAGPDDAANITLAALSIGMCVAAAASLGSNVGMSARFMLGALPVTTFSLMFVDSSAAFIAAGMGGTLGVTLLYMAHMKYNDTVQMLEVRIGLELSNARLESAVKTLGIGLEIKDKDGRTVFCNKTMQANRALIENTPRNRDGFYQHQQNFYRRNQFEGVEGDHLDLIEDVTSLVDSQREILLSRQQAEDALRNKSAFFESISKEVIYPIADISKYARLLMPDSQIKMSRDDLGQLAMLIGNAARDLKGLMSSITHHGMADDDTTLTESETVKLRDRFRKELRDSAPGLIEDEVLARLSQAIPANVMVKASACEPLTRALGKMSLKAIRAADTAEEVEIFVRKMDKPKASLCFIVRAKRGHGIDARTAQLNETLEQGGGSATFNEYASYISAKFIEDLGGVYREDSSDDKMVSIIAIVPREHVFLTETPVKAPSAQSASY